MMGWHGDGMGWGGWLVMSLGTLIFWSVVVLTVVAGVRMWRGQTGGRSDDDAVRLLDERFARGEIDAEEYRTRRDVLRSGRR